MSTLQTQILTRTGTIIVRRDARGPLPAADIVRSGYFAWKRYLDVFLASLLMVPALPVIALLALVVRLTSRGPGLYRQTRVGHNRRLFKMCKIRTMYLDAEQAAGPVWTRPGDVRITPVGRALRRMHLDELPQLFNVLKGEMSLIGPRPERPEFVAVLEEAVPGFHDRLAVRPGVTGLAQLNLPPDTDIQSVERKLVLDREYIMKANVGLDLRIFLCTALRIVKVNESLLLWALRLRRHPPAISAAGTPAQDAGVPLTPALVVAAVEGPATADSTTPSNGNGKHHPHKPR